MLESASPARRFDDPESTEKDAARLRALCGDSRVLVVLGLWTSLSGEIIEKDPGLDGTDIREARDGDLLLPGSPCRRETSRVDIAGPRGGPSGRFWSV